MSTRHPQVRQCEQYHQLRGVLGQAAEAYLHVTELALESDYGSAHRSNHPGDQRPARRAALPSFRSVVEVQSDDRRTGVKAHHSIRVRLHLPRLLLGQLSAIPRPTPIPPLTGQLADPFGKDVHALLMTEPLGER